MRLPLLPFRSGCGRLLLRAGAALLLALALWGPARPAHALEVYALLNRDCAIHTGLIIHVDAARVSLLNVDGGLTVLPRTDVHRILVFNTLDNPIPRLNLAGPLGALTREVHLSGTDGPSYLGWPIRFQEEAIIFFDTDGKTHVEDVDRVELVREAGDGLATQTLPEAVPRTFTVGSTLPECADVSAGSGPLIHPTRVISDQIKISRFLAAYDAGFAELERFRRRSTFYARPFLYERQTKVALSLTNFPNLESPEAPPLLPVYFQWSSGSAYASQGLVVLGAKPVEWLPNVEPVFALRSEVKSSFFSASFVGNPFALSVGKDFIVENRFAYGDFFSRYGPGDTLVFPHLNHLAMTGLDWGAYSAALGYYYPVVGILDRDVFREVVSPEPAIAYRLLRTGARTALRVTYAASDLGSNNPEREDLRIVTGADMRDPAGISEASTTLQTTLQAFSLRSEFVRVGADLDLNDELQVGLDQVRFWGTYREAFPGEASRLRYDHLITSLHAFQQFGDFVALRGALNYFDRAYERRVDDTESSPHGSEFSLTVAIEFVL